MATTGPQVGDLAPDFELVSQAGEKIRLSDHRGQIVVLYFYPKDETAGCTAQACSLRDSHEDFTDAGAVVIGVSSDSVESHQKFAAHHRLPFTLVSDTGGEVRKRYGIQSVLGLFPGRVTYVIDGDGVIRHMFDSLSRIGGHVKGALAVVRDLQVKSS